jgi:hypothetical protein
MQRTASIPANPAAPTTPALKLIFISSILLNRKLHRKKTANRLQAVHVKTAFQAREMVT